MCLRVYMCTTCVQEPTDVSDAEYPWNWSYRWLYAIMWMLGTLVLCKSSNCG